MPVDSTAFVPTEREVFAAAKRVADAGGFTGGPVERFVEAGRMQFDLLLRHGVTADSRVVDVGAGAFRLGYWLMNFLDPGNYCALEPSAEMRAAGVQIVGADLVERSRPVLDDNPDFDLAAFGRCDFGIARSVWTHASMPQIDLLLASWARHGRGPLFASYLPAGLRHRAYRGAGWVGISHESSTPGLVRHRLRDIARRAGTHGLEVEPTGEPSFAGQVWLTVAKR